MKIKWSKKMNVMDDSSLKEFLSFCEACLESKGLNLSKAEKDGFIKLMKKHLNESCKKFIDSEDFKDLLNLTWDKIENEPSKIFVHMRDFNDELKAYRKVEFRNKLSGLKRTRESTPVSDDPSSKHVKREPSEFDLSSKHVKCEPSEFDLSRKHVKREPSEFENEVVKEVYIATSDGEKIPQKKLDLSNDKFCCKGEGSVFDIKLQYDIVKHQSNLFTNNSEMVNCKALSDVTDSAPLTETKTDTRKNKCTGLEIEVEVSIGNKECNLAENGNSSEQSNASVEEDEAGVNVWSIPNTRIEANNKEDVLLQNNSTEKKNCGSDRQIRRLEKLLKDIRDEIERLRENELTLEEMDDECSDYIKEDKLQKKFVKVWEKLCSIKGRQKTTGRSTEREFKYRGTRYPEINRRIQRFVNKKKIFPDYQDIRRLVRAANNKYNMSMSSSAVERISREAFTDVGNKLQQRRQEDFVCDFGCRLTDGYRTSVDPALYDPGLRRKLHESRTEAKKKMEEVFNKFADKELASGEVGDVVETDKEESEPEDVKSPVSDLNLERQL